MTAPTEDAAPPPLSVQSFRVCFGATCFGFMLLPLAVFGLVSEYRKQFPHLKDGGEFPPWLKNLQVVHARREFALLAILSAAALSAACGAVAAVWRLTAWPWYVGHPIFGFTSWAIIALPASMFYRPVYLFLAGRFPAPNLIVPTSDSGAGSGLTIDPSALPGRMPARFRFRTVQRRGLVREILERQSQTTIHTDILAESDAEDWTETLSAFESHSVPLPPDDCLFRLKAVDGEAWACEFCA